MMRQDVTDIQDPIITVVDIEPGWRDYNGHVNYAAYAMAADPAIDAAYAAVGLDRDFRMTHGRSDYVIESRFFYFREIRGGRSIEVRARLIDFDAKRTHIFCEICDRDHGSLAAVAHIVCIHVDSFKARSAEIPDFARERLSALKAAHARLPEPEYFDDTVVLGRRIGKSLSR